VRNPEQKSPPEFSMPPLRRLEHVWAARRMLGLTVFIAVDVAFLAYLLTFSVWWFLLPFVAFVFTWRFAYGAWPILGTRQ
jgi:hypothetical protein